MRRLACALALFLLAAPAAWTDELPEATRRMAERAFLEGRLEDVTPILSAASTPADRYPLRALLWWRGLEALDGSEPPHPARLDGGEGAWPLIQALLQERHRREQAGAQGLPEGGTLHAAARRLDEEAYAEELWFLDDAFRLQRETYGEPLELPAEERRRYRSLTWTAQISAQAALGAFVVLVFFAALLVSRGAREARRGKGRRRR